MPYVRAIVSDEEKQGVGERAKTLNMTESELLREGLKKMGCQIEVKKDVGAPIGNNNNPGGNPNFGKAVTGRLKSKGSKK